MSESYRFGPFRLDIETGILFWGSEPTELGQRATTLLRTLLQQAGMPVTKDALIDAAWPGLAVEDSNLAVQVAALRRVLTEKAGAGDWIETLPRRGYRYAGPPLTSDQRTKNQPQPAIAVTEPHTPSIVVLPFSNLSGDPAQDYFADGMVDDIINGLSRIKWLFVIARNSALAYKDRSIDLNEVRQQLGVRYVLQGSVRKQTDHLRVTVQLIDTTSSTHLWGERYDRRTSDVFALQDEIALAVVAAIEPNLRQAEVERVRRKRPDNLDAYDLVLQAQSDIYSGMPDRATTGLALLNRALALDPSYALAHGFAAMGFHNRFLRAGLKDEDRTASIQHAEAAIANGQDDALALTFAGFSIGMDAHDRAAAFTALNAALAISSSSALTYILGSVLFGWAGEADRAIEWGEKGLRLSPFDPWAFAAFHSIMLGNFYRSRYEEAASAAYKAVQTNPGHSISHMLLSAALVKRGNLEDAKAVAARVLQLQPGFQYSRQFRGVDCLPALAAALSEALAVAGLPE